MNIIFIIFIYFINVKESSGTFSSSEPDIKIYFFSPYNPSNGIQVNISNPTKVAEIPFSSELDTYFYIHGWKDDVQSLTSTGQKLKYFLLLKHNINIFLVDWSSLSSNVLYPLVANNVENVGKLLGNMIWSLVENNGLNFDRTTIAGTNFGAHVAGVAGRELDGKIAQLVGIDPAGPWFTFSSANRITPSSAKFVQVIHTSGGRLGYSEPLGHADYYPNGGQAQPMCGTDAIGSCAQSMAFDYYCESLLSGRFKAKKCDSYDNFLNKRCDASEESWMGEYILDKRAKGLYYLNTNNYPPYAIY